MYQVFCAGCLRSHQLKMNFRFRKRRLKIPELLLCVQRVLWHVSEVFHSYSNIHHAITSRDPWSLFLSCCLGWHLTQCSHPKKQTFSWMFLSVSVKLHKVPVWALSCSQTHHLHPHNDTKLPLDFLSATHLDYFSCFFFVLFSYGLVHYSNPLWRYHTQKH